MVDWMKLKIVCVCVHTYIYLTFALGLLCIIGCMLDFAQQSAKYSELK